MFKVAIPSYKRSDVIMDKTLATLRRGRVALSDIYIFVVDDEQEAYKKACPGYQIQVGLLGLIEQRSFIQGYLPLDTNIVMMDDDISGIYRPIDSKTREEIIDLPSLFCSMILRMQIENVSIAGVYPVLNNKFALGNKEITTDFRYLVGAFYLIKNLRMPDVQLDSSDPASHEDKIRTIKYYQKEGKTLRFSWVQIKTKYFGKGGLDSPDRLKQHASEAESLCLRFPEYLRLQKSKKLTDCKFRRVKKA
jgi:hypothetical protein